MIMEMICQFDIFRFLSIVCWQHFVEVHAQGFNILVMRHQEQYNWAIPLDGNWQICHFTAHCVSCFNDLYFLPFSCSIAIELGFGKAIKHKDYNITNFKH
jgi:hypothetical protein